MDIVEEGKKVFNTEIEALVKMRDILDDVFVEIVNLITNCSSKVIFTGIGKPGHICKKLAATMASLGTPSFYLHPGEAMHGDLGMISENDVVIAISYSGESDEVIRILSNIRLIGAKLIGITANGNSTLAKNSDIVQVLPAFDEACYLGLAPTASTTVALCYGDALAVVASGIYGFGKADFGMYHPAGALGKKLIIKVTDLMVSDDENAIITKDALFADAIVEMGKKRLGVVNVVDDDMKLIGIITDGDIRRIIEKKVDVYSAKVKNVMIKNPKLIASYALAVDALECMRQNSINCLPIVDDNMRVIGTVTLQMIVKAGIVI